MAYAAAMRALVVEAVAGEENEREILARYYAGLTRLVHQYAGGNVGSLPAA